MIFGNTTWIICFQKESIMLLKIKKIKKINPVDLLFWGKIEDPSRHQSTEVDRSAL